MFSNTIDKKLKIIDNNGNEIVDLTTSIFKKSARGLSAFNTVRLIDYFLMRPDKVAFNEYKSDEGTEYILKYSGISNPFSLDKDDVLLIPNLEEAAALMTDLTTEQNPIENLVKLYYKFTNTDFKSSSASYDNLANKKIPSGVLTTGDTGSYIVPYISDDGGTSITIKNGRMYFGNNSVTTKTNEEFQAELDKQCIVNGMTMTDFVKANTANSETLND